MALLNLNGYKHFIDVNSIKVKPVSAGRWEVTFDEGRTFTVIGGRHSGGASNEWFCHSPELYGEEWLPTRSMIAAIRLGAQY